MKTENSPPEAELPEEITKALEPDYAGNVSAWIAGGDPRA